MPLLILEAATSMLSPLPSPEKSLKEYSNSERLVDVGRERTKQALREEVGDGGGLASDNSRDSGV